MDYNHEVLLLFLSRNNNVGQLVREILKNPYSLNIIRSLNHYFPVEIITKNKNYLCEICSLNIRTSHTSTYLYLYTYDSKKDKVIEEQIKKEDIISYRFLKSNILYGSFEEFYNFFKSNHISEEGIRILWKNYDLTKFSLEKIPTQSKSVLETISLQNNNKDFELKASVDGIDYYVNKDFVIINNLNLYIVGKDGNAMRVKTIYSIKEARKMLYDNNN